MGRLPTSLLLLAALLADPSWAFTSIGNGIGSNIHRVAKNDATTSTRASRTTLTQAAAAATPAGSTAEPTAPRTASAPPPVERVAIIGAGIAGLSLAHALRSADMVPSASENAMISKIDIFDSRADLDETSGSGIQLTGGMAALREISPGLQRKVSEAALPLERVVSRCRPWFGGDATTTTTAKAEDDDGWKILELDIQQSIRDKVAADAAAAAAAATEGNGGEAKHEKGGLVTEEGEVLAYTILRGTLQRMLQEELSTEHGIEVRFDKRLSGLSYSDDSNNPPENDGEEEEDEGEEEGITCQFADGSTAGPYDLVIGCDGIQSAVKQFIDTGTIVPRSSSSKGDYAASSALYSGLRITFAIQEDATTIPGGESDIVGRGGCQFTQFFGNGAYALTSTYGAGKGRAPARGAFLVYPDENYVGPFPKSMFRKEEEENVASSSTTTASNPTDGNEAPPLAAPLDENADWTEDNRVNREHITECLEVIRSSSIPGNDVATIVENSDRFFDLGVYLHNPFSWNGWVREVPRGNGNGGGGGGGKTGKYAVTTGDASHAMPPFLGQGANQALQDSYSLAAKIFEYNSLVQKPLDGNDPSSPKLDLKTLLKEYENKRWLPTTSITAKAALLGYLEVGPSIFSNFRDAFFFVMGKIGVAKKVFLDAATPKM